MVRTLLRGLAVALLLVLVAPLGWRLATGDFFMTVTGTSMEPTYSVGDVLVVRQPTGHDLRPDGVVVIRLAPADGSASSMYVHRVETLTPDGAWLRGDGNDAPDPRPVTEPDVAGTPRAVLQGTAAALFAGTQTLTGRALIGAAALALLLVRFPPGLPAHRRPARNGS